MGSPSKGEVELMMTDFLESKIDDGLAKIEGQFGDILRAEHERIDEATEDVKN